MPSVVVDTTVLISGFLTPEGVSGKLLHQAQAGAFRLCLSREILEELSSRLLHRRRIRKSYRYSDARVHQHCRDLETAARLITDLPKVRVVERDPNDDMIIACAVKARADYVVTRDTGTRVPGSDRATGRLPRPQRLWPIVPEPHAMAACPSLSAPAHSHDGMIEEASG
jgi:uncharacterized protein